MLANPESLYDILVKRLRNLWKRSEKSLLQTKKDLKQARKDLESWGSVAPLDASIRERIRVLKIQEKNYKKLVTGAIQDIKIAKQHVAKDKL